MGPGHWATCYHSPGCSRQPPPKSPIPPPLATQASLAHAQRDMPGNHVNRTFGVGGNTTGHVVTWLTPHIHSHSSLVSHLRRLAHTSVRAELTLNRTPARGWDVRARVGVRAKPDPNPGPNSDSNPDPNPNPTHLDPDPDPDPDPEPDPEPGADRRLGCPRLGGAWHAVCGAARVWRRWLRHRAGLALGRGIHAHPGGHAEHVHAGETPPSHLSTRTRHIRKPPACARTRWSQ